MPTLRDVFGANRGKLRMAEQSLAATALVEVGPAPGSYARNYGMSAIASFEYALSREFVPSAVTT
jgi:hypothetical protein